MKPKQFEKERSSLGSKVKVADALELNPRTIYNYEKGEHIPRFMEYALLHLKSLVKAGKKKV